MLGTIIINLKILELFLRKKKKKYKNQSEKCIENRQNYFLLLLSKHDSCKYRCMLELKESLPSVFGAHDKDLNFAPD